MKHEEDDQDLGIFVKGDKMVIACKGGHFWVLDVSQIDTTSNVRSPEYEDIAEQFRAATEFAQ